MAKTVLITGASQGIGKATALKFARHGHDMVLASRQPDPLAAVADEVQAMGRRVLAVPTDVREVEQVNALAEKAINHFGYIDVLINNAGIFAFGPVDGFALEDWHRVIDTNLWGYIHTIHALLPHLLKQGSATIVNVSSIGGIEAIPYQVPYATTKYAVTGLTKALHAELSPKGIQVCGIYPNFIKTSVLERAVIRDQDEQGVEDRHELMRNAIKTPFLEKPEDVANAIWKAVKDRQSDVLVGTTNAAQFIYNLFPGVMQSMYRQVLGLKANRA